MNFDNRELSGYNFSGINFSNSKFVKATICNADLTNTNFDSAQLYKADLMGTDLSNSSFKDAKFEKTDLSYTNWENSILSDGYFYDAKFSNAKLKNIIAHNANFCGTDFTNVDLTGADLSNSKFQRASFIQTNIEQTILKNCNIFGISVWGTLGTPKDQSSLIITLTDDAQITTDDLQVAQFIYLLLNRENLRNVIQTLSSKAVLILGRFTPERKIILDTIAQEVRQYNLLPIIFDFEKANSRDFTETIKIIAGMSLFVIADITNPKSSPLELQATVPDYRIPFIPIIQNNEKPFSMFNDLIGKFDWVLQPISYSSVDSIKAVFKTLILERALTKHKEIQLIKAQAVETLSADEFLKSLN
jgi:uncharacterized protein YjbI with pentapeptide repeats